MREYRRRRSGIVRAAARLPLGRFKPESFIRGRGVFNQFTTPGVITTQPYQRVIAPSTAVHSEFENYRYSWTRGGVGIPMRGGCVC